MSAADVLQGHPPGTRYEWTQRVCMSGLILEFGKGRTHVTDALDDATGDRRYLESEGWTVAEVHREGSPWPWLIRLHACRPVRERDR